MTTIYAHKALLPSGWADRIRLHISGERIERIKADASSAGDDVRVDYVIPGLCNAHCHVFQRALAGWTEERSPAGQDNFWTWRERMYRLVPLMDATELRIVARQAYIEMLLGGYTSVAEFHYLHKQPGSDEANDLMFKAVRDAALESRMRLCYVPVFYERAGFEQQQPEGAQRGFVLDFDLFLEHYYRTRDSSEELLTVGLGAHSIRAVSQGMLEEIASIANAASIPMHIHVAEQRAEVEQSVAFYQRRPVQWLFENFAVGANWCLVHATHVDAEEVRVLAASGAVACLCPSTEANLGDGLFPLANYLRQNGQIAIGSDSNVTINAFEELRWLEYGQRLLTETRNVATQRDNHVGYELYSRAFEGGARATGMRVSGIVEGAAADLVTLRADDPMLAGHGDDTRLDALVFSGYRLPIDAVMVGGEWCVRNGVHCGAEESRAAFKDTMERVNGRLPHS